MRRNLYLFKPTCRLCIYFVLQRHCTVPSIVEDKQFQPFAQVSHQNISRASCFFPSKLLQVLNCFSESRVFLSLFYNHTTWLTGIGWCSYISLSIIYNVLICLQNSLWLYFTVTIFKPAHTTHMKIVFLQWDCTREYEVKAMRRKAMESWLQATTSLKCVTDGDPRNWTTSLQTNFMPSQNQTIGVGVWIWSQSWQKLKLLILASCISP